MGCAASRFDENGMVIPLKARTLLLFRIEEFKKRRHSQAVTYTRPSKKVLLPEVKEEDDNYNFAPIKQTLSKNDGRVDSSSLTDDTGSCVTSESSKGGSPERERLNNDAKAKRDEGEEHDHEGKLTEPLAKDNGQVEDEHDDDEEEDGNDGRMIGHHADDLAFPGSLSFRVYFRDDNKGDNKIEGWQYALISWFNINHNIYV